MQLVFLSGFSWVLMMSIPTDVYGKMELLNYENESFNY